MSLATPNIVICSLQQAQQCSSLIQAGFLPFYDVAVQISDIDASVELPVLALTSHKFKFDDIPDLPEHFSNPSDDTGPSQADIEALIKLGKNIPVNSTVLCHCLAGISRSAAAAIIISCSSQPQSSVSIIKDLFTAHPAISPNVRMLALAERLDSRLIGKLLTSLP